MTLIAVKELTVSYIEYHPILKKIVELKEDIAKIYSQFTKRS